MKQKWFRKMIAMALSATMMCTAMPIAASANFEEGGVSNPNVSAEETVMTVPEFAEETRTDSRQADSEPGENVPVQESVDESGTDRARISKDPGADITSEFTDSNFLAAIKEY